MVLNPFQITQTAERIQDELRNLETPLHTNSFGEKPEMVEPIIKDINAARALVTGIKERILSLQTK